jgi:hypothetical protein
MDRTSIKDQIKALRSLKQFDEYNDLFFDSEGLNWLDEVFEQYYPKKWPPPYLYPALDGAVSVEWDQFKIGEVSLTILLQKHIAIINYWFKFSDNDTSEILDLNNHFHWEYLIQLLTGLFDDL